MPLPKFGDFFITAERLYLKFGDFFVTAERLYLNSVAVSSLRKVFQLCGDCFLFSEAFSSLRRLFFLFGDILIRSESLCSPIFGIKNYSIILFFLFFNTDGISHPLEVRWSGAVLVNFKYLSYTSQLTFIHFRLTRATALLKHHHKLGKLGFYRLQRELEPVV